MKCTFLILYTNQNLIATCAFLQTNPEKLNVIKNGNNNNEYNSKLIIDKLKEIKTQQIKIKVIGFYLNQKLFFEREVNKNFVPEIEEEEDSDDDMEYFENTNKLKIKNKYLKTSELQDYLYN